MKNRRAVKLAGKICGGAVTAVLAVLLAANLCVLAAQRLGAEDSAVLGLRSAVVLTGSMSGTIEPDDLVVTYEEASYAAGDIIMFRSGSHTVTHRITAVTPEGYRTRGDANNTEDAAVTPPEDVLGRVILVVPGAGGAVRLLRTPLGMLCLVLVVPLVLWLPETLGRRRVKEA